MCGWCWLVAFFVGGDAGGRGGGGVGLRSGGRRLARARRPKGCAPPSRIWKHVSTKKPAKQEPSHECKPSYQTAILSRSGCGGSEVPSGRGALVTRTSR